MNSVLICFIYVTLAPIGAPPEYRVFKLVFPADRMFIICKHGTGLDIHVAFSQDVSPDGCFPAR